MSHFFNFPNSYMYQCCENVYFVLGRGWGGVVTPLDRIGIPIAPLNGLRFNIFHEEMPPHNHSPITIGCPVCFRQSHLGRMWLGCGAKTKQNTLWKLNSHFESEPKAQIHGNSFAQHKYPPAIRVPNTTIGANGAILSREVGMPTPLEHATESCRHNVTMPQLLITNWRDST